MSEPRAIPFDGARPLIVPSITPPEFARRTEAATGIVRDLCGNENFELGPDCLVLELSDPRIVAGA